MDVVPSSMDQAGGTRSSTETWMSRAVLSLFFIYSCRRFLDASHPGCLEANPQRAPSYPFPHLIPVIYSYPQLGISQSRSPQVIERVGTWRTTAPGSFNRTVNLFLLDLRALDPDLHLSAVQAGTAPARKRQGGSPRIKKTVTLWADTTPG